MVTNKYKNTNIGTVELESETNRYYTMVNVDSLGIVELSFASAFSVRLNYNEVEKLESLIVSAKQYIEDQAIDQAGSQIINNDSSEYAYKDPNDPSSW